MMKKILILVFILPVFCVSAESKLDNGSDGIFILTVDDLALSNDEEIELVEDILDFLERYEVPVTFFAIPDRMKHYDFSSYSVDVEIAQHGFNHVNPKFGTYDEFRWLGYDEVRERIYKGNEMLENMGYDVKGFRAPCWSLKEGYSDVLRDLFVYDSSFDHKIEGIIELDHLKIDLVSYLCRQNKCDNMVMRARKEILLSLIDRRIKKGKPFVVLSHFWGFYELFGHEEGIKYLNDFFQTINERNYTKMTMIEYANQKRF